MSFPPCLMHHKCRTKTLRCTTTRLAQDHHTDIIRDDGNIAEDFKIWKEIAVAGKNCKNCTLQNISYFVEHLHHMMRQMLQSNEGVLPLQRTATSTSRGAAQFVTRGLAERDSKSKEDYSVTMTGGALRSQQATPGQK